MEIQQIQQIRKYLDIVVRRKFLITSFILIGAAAGLAFYLLEPKVYQASTLLSYQQQKVSPAKMSPDVQVRISDSVSTLSQIITSRTSLEGIIENIGLYQGARQNLPMEDVIEIMRRNIDISPSRRGDTFRISFTGGDPGKVARVANTLAAKFIEENLKYRQERATETFSYTSDELEMAKDVLDRKEKVMRDYKLQYYNEMPEQRANNMQRLNSLQEQYQNRQDSIQDLERTRVLIQDQLALRKRMIEESRQFRETQAAANAKESSAIMSDAERLTRLKDKLEQMLGRYTEKHPAVRQLKKQISRLEESIQADPKNSTMDADSGSEQYDKVLLDLQLQLKDIRFNIERLNQEKDELRKSIDKYEKWIEAAPVRGAEWSALTREYGELKRHYDFLVAQNLQARSALNLERKQKGSQFKIEDPARPPQTPTKPDFLKIIFVALAAGTGIGGGLALGREILDSSFKDPSEVEEFLDVELLCTVPQLSLKKEKTKSLVINIIGIALLVICTSIILAAFVYFYKTGKIVF